jgi:hypothetical protein
LRGQIVHRAEHLAGATLVRDALVAAGVRAEIRGEHRPNLMFVVPMSEVWVEVVVDVPDVARAEQVLRRYFGPELVRDDWVCPRCGEAVPGNFELCWRCDDPG